MHIINICREIREIPNLSKSAYIAEADFNLKMEPKLDAPIIAVIAKPPCSATPTPAGFPQSGKAHRFRPDFRE